MKSVLLLSLLALVNAAPFWERPAEEDSLDRVVGLRGGAYKQGKLRTQGDVSRTHGGYDVYGEVVGIGETGGNAGGSLFGNDIDVEGGVRHGSKVYGAGGYGRDNRGDYLRGGVGGESEGTLWGAGGIRRGEHGLAAEAKLTGKVKADAGGEIRRHGDGGFSGKGELSGGARVGGSIDFRPFKG